MVIKLREREIERERKVLDLPISDLQRIAIARALLKNAPILILDEVSFCLLLCASISLHQVTITNETGIITKPSSTCFSESSPHLA